MELLEILLVIGLHFVSGFLVAILLVATDDDVLYYHGKLDEGKVTAVFLFGYLSLVIVLAYVFIYVISKPLSTIGNLIIKIGNKLRF